MLDIELIAIGKIRENFYQEASNEYLKRLKPFAKIKITELSPESFGKNTPKERIKKIESEKLLKYLEKQSFENILLLHERGKEKTSTEFSQFLHKKQGKIALVIAGTLGFGKNILDKSYEELSLSQMTFPHEMARMILLEQIYRAICIEIGKDYHY